jgi:hypothetical protein
VAFLHSVLLHTSFGFSENMHDLEPFHRWRDLYVAAQDAQSPFYGRKYSEFQYTQRIYNFYIHPQWDSIGSSTLYLKVLYTDYDAAYAIIELIGEWNDVLHEDIMVLKHELLEPMLDCGIHQFIFICDNLLNFHAGDTDYYSELKEALDDERPRGWVVMLNTHQHVFEEMDTARLDDYLHYGPHFNDQNWRVMKPDGVLELVQSLLEDRTLRL